MTKVSVIVPVHNSENFIEKSVRSLFSQTMKNDIEFIFINDCTPDQSIAYIKKLLKEYPTRQNQVKIINNSSNLGVSASRQKGLEFATGEYVIHADPDDYVDPNMYEELYNKAVETSADIVFCDFIKHFRTYSEKSIQNPQRTQGIDVLPMLFGGLHGSTWNKLVKRSFITQNKITFDPTLTYCEDLVFNAQLLKANPSVSYCPGFFYHYQLGFNDNSLVKKYEKKNFEQDKYLAEELRKIGEGTSAQKKITVHNAVMRIGRAFRGHILSSKEFHHEFGKQANLIWKSRLPLKWRGLYWLATKGFYRQAYKIYLSRIKN